LHGLSLFDVAVFPKPPKDVLDDFSLLGGRSSAEDVKADSKPVVYVFVEGMVFCAEDVGFYAFFNGLGFGSCAVFVLTRVSSIEAPFGGK
jgi:hypothetical protein